MGIQKISKPYDSESVIHAASDAVLIDDHRWMHAYYANMKRGDKFENWTVETVSQTHAQIVHEMLSRGLYPNVSLELDQQKDTVDVIKHWLESDLFKYIKDMDEIQLKRAVKFIAQLNSEVPHIKEMGDYSMSYFIAAIQALDVAIQKFDPNYDSGPIISGEEKSLETVGDTFMDWILDDEVTDIDKAFAPFSVLGGKQTRAKALAEITPTDCTTYCEPFSGAASVLFCREPVAKEVISDTNPGTIALLKFTRDFDAKDLEIMASYDWSPPSKDQFYAIRDMKVKNKYDLVFKTLITRYWGYWQGRTYSASIVAQRSQLHGTLWDRTVKKLSAAQPRLKNVQILEQDFRKTIEENDSPETFFFIDPPYGTTGPREWPMPDWDEIAKILSELQGRFLMTVHVDSKTKQAFKPFRCDLVDVKIRNNHLADKPGQQVTRKELLVSNFDVAAKKQNVEEYAPIGASGHEIGKEVTLEEALSFFPDTYVIDSAFISLGGELAKGEVDTKVELHVNGSFDPDMTVPLEFRLGRGSSFASVQSINYHKSEPYADTLPLYALVCKRVNSENQIIQMSHDSRPADILMEEANEMVKSIVKTTILKSDENIELKDVLKEALPIVLRKPFVFLVGGVVNRGTTKGDMDVLIRGIFEKEFRDKITTPVLDASPMPNRIHILQDYFHGPFTPHIPVYDLVLEPIKYDVDVLKQNLAEANEYRIKDKEIAQQAEMSTREDIVDMFRFFIMMKPTKGSQPKKRQSIESFLELFSEKDFPVYNTKKYDGNAHVIWKDGDKVKIQSITGVDNTSHFPNVVKEVQELKFDKLALCCEIELWDGDMHLPREAAAGSFHSSDQSDDSQVIVNVFDCVYADEDIHGRSFEERDTILNKLGCGQSTDEVPDTDIKLNKTPAHLCKDIHELKKSVEELSLKPGSEGTVTKRANGIYVLDGKRGQQIKFHVTGDCFVTILKKTPIKGSTSVWTYGVGVTITLSEDRKERIPSSDVMTLPGRDGRQFVFLGNTFSSSQNLRIGDVAVMEYEQVNLTYNEDKDTVEISTYFPRLLLESVSDDDITDSMNSLINKARKARVLVEKVIKDGTQTFETFNKDMDIGSESISILPDLLTEREYFYSNPIPNIED